MDTLLIVNVAKPTSIRTSQINKLYIFTYLWFLNNNFCFMIMAKYGIVCWYRLLIYVIFKYWVCISSHVLGLFVNTALVRWQLCWSLDGLKKEE